MELGQSRIKDNNYYQISGWMINRLKLKGASLNVYAIIYGFSQDGESEFTGSRQYLADFINSTKPTVDKALNELCEKEYIFKTQKIINNVTFNTYKANMEAVNILCGGSKETLPPDKETLLGGSKETLLGGSKETLHNNKSLNNKSLNNKSNRKEEIKKDSSPSSYETIINNMIFDETVKETIFEFIKMRKLIKKPLTDFALKRLIQRLQTLSGEPQEQVEILEKSINNNWLGIFPLKDEEASAPRAYQQQGGNVFLDIAHDEGIL